MPSASAIKLKNLYSFFIEKEREALSLLIPILFISGIGTYFFVNTEPQFLKTATGFLTCVFISALCFFKRRHLFLISIAITIFAAGFFIANFRAVYVKAPKVPENIGVIWLRGNVDLIETKGKTHRIMVKNLDLWQPKKGKFSEKETPIKARINIRTKFAEDLKEGDYIQVKVILSPPPKTPAIPGGYDFARSAYFEQIGATGFAIAEVKTLKKAKSQQLMEYANNLRRKISERILASVSDKDNAAIISEMLVNEEAGLDPKLEDKIRQTGLGHLLAISGMHMTVAIIWFFVFARMVMALIPLIALKYNTKKIAAVISAALGLCYLLLTGMPVSAVRAYIMVVIFFIAILIDRINSPMRTISVAAILILIVEPESVIGPGFQMSFAAVIALIAYYEYRKKKYDEDDRTQKPFLKKCVSYFYEILITTIIAGVVTSFYSIYHFNNYPKYSIPANMIGIPGITFLGLPFGFIAMFAMIFGVEYPFLKLSELGVRIMNFAAECFTSSGQPVFFIPQLPGYFLLLASVGMAFLFTFKTRLKYIGVPLILYVVFLIFYTKPADMIIDSSGKTFALRCDEDLYVFGKRKGWFVLDQWKSKLAVSGHAKFKPFEDTSTIKECGFESESVTEKLKSFDAKNGTTIFWLGNHKSLSLQDFHGSRVWSK